MSKKNAKLPGKGDYGEITAYMSKRQVYTKSELIEFAIKNCHKGEAAAIGTAVVMLSPRETSNRGDCRGNISNPWGHIAYNEKLIRKINKETGKPEEQRFRIRRRKVELEPKLRNVLSVEAKKVKVPSKTSTKVTKKSKVKAK